MAKSIKDNPKKRGRPATGKAPMVGVRMPEEFQEKIRAWSATQADAPVLAEAIRRLVDLGLAGAPAGRAKRTAASSKSSDMAGTQLDKMADKSASADDQASRKRQLLKGPSEFRDVRKDRPKGKS